MCELRIGEREGLGGPGVGCSEVDRAVADRKPTQSEPSESERAARVVRLAWLSLPISHRALLEAIGASQWQVVDRPLGAAADEFLLSAGHQALPVPVRRALDLALGVWVQELRIVLLRAGRPELAGLDEPTFEVFVARTAWHEWAHALSVARCTSEDIAAGRRMLDLAPSGVRDGIRGAGYRSNDYTHELVAETYALLMARRRRGGSGRPQWLNTEIYNLVMKVTGWSD